MSIKVLSLTKYEGKPTHQNINYDKFSEMIKKGINGEISEKSVHELLDKDKRKMYFDIEKIPETKPELINEMIDALKKFFETKKVRNIKYVLTINEGSPHEGLSYHLIFYNYSCYYNELKDAVKEFLFNNEKYNTYLDTSVYSVKRLFKMPYNYGIIKGKGVDLNSNNYHKIVEIPENLDKSTLSRYVIQDTNGTIFKRLNVNAKLKSAITKIKYTEISAGDKDAPDSVIDDLIKSIEYLYKYLHDDKNKNINSEYKIIIDGYYKKKDSIDKKHYLLVKKVIDQMLKNLNIKMSDVLKFKEENEENEEKNETEGSEESED